MSRLVAVIPAAGTGSRLGAAMPKQYLEIEGRSLLAWSLDAVLACDDISVCAVALPSQQACEEFLTTTHRERGGDRVVDRVVACVGGATRAESVSAGIAALAAHIDLQDSDWVLVHDAARPCLDRRDVDKLVAQVLSRDTGGLLAQRVSDTLKEVTDDQLVASTADRNKYWLAQTPQMFRIGELSKALSRLQEQTFNDEASAMETAGYPVQIVEGSVSNLKVTYPEDLELAEFWLRRQRAESASPAGDAI